MFAQQTEFQNIMNERKKELLSVDVQFSRLSEARGVNEAFMAQLADDGVLLRPNNYPITGKAIIKERFFSRPDSGYSLTWKPLFADVAESGELGYTYGVYEFRAVDPEGNPIVGNGTYVTIWKKDQFRNWKIALDSGNEGLEPFKK
jgi:ketosteroid isomerase-like protein